MSSSEEQDGQERPEEFELKSWGSDEPIKMTRAEIDFGDGTSMLVPQPVKFRELPPEPSRGHGCSDLGSGPDWDEWKYGPRTNPQEQVATGERAAEIEGVLRRNIEHPDEWAYRDRKIGFPFGLVFLLVVLLSVLGLAGWYLWLRLGHLFS